MKRFKHSGALGDLIYSLPIVKHFGGGEFYLHLNQMDWIGQHYYGSPPAPFHQGRMTQGDFEYMQSFMQAQGYIRRFDTLTPDVEITHNLDRFRPAFVNHPSDYVTLYAAVFGLSSDAARTVSSEPWLTVPTPMPIPGRPIVINRTQRWTPATLSAQWSQWRAQGWEQQAVFVGLAQEHAEFVRVTGWQIPYHPTQNMLELAQVIAGAETFVGNQSQAFALAVGLGVGRIHCEARTDLPLNRNECYFPLRPTIQYF
jgi:hypothetical protein